MGGSRGVSKKTSLPCHHVLLLLSICICFSLIVEMCSGISATRIEFFSPNQQQQHPLNVPQSQDFQNLNNNGDSLLKLSEFVQTSVPKAQLSFDEYHVMLAFDSEDPYYLARKEALAIEAAKVNLSPSTTFRDSAELLCVVWEKLEAGKLDDNIVHLTHE
jgi:hypothetical protein